MDFDNRVVDLRLRAFRRTFLGKAAIEIHAFLEGIGYELFAASRLSIEWTRVQFRASEVDIRNQLLDKCARVRKI
eukprot:13758217-Alexandrium_andersonii.AAC.1